MNTQGRLAIIEQNQKQVSENQAVFNERLNAFEQLINKQPENKALKSSIYKDLVAIRKAAADDFLSLASVKDWPKHLTLLDKLIHSYVQGDYNDTN